MVSGEKRVILNKSCEEECGELELEWRRGIRRGEWEWERGLLMGVNHSRQTTPTWAPSPSPNYSPK